MTELATATRVGKIVVVEDEPDIGALLEYALGQEGFRVRVVRDGHTALERIEEDPPDLMVLDLMLPDMNGLDVLRAIRNSAKFDRTRVIILSAKRSEEDRVTGFELGADDYVVKPFSPRELVLRIRTTLQHVVPRQKAEGEEARPHLRVGPIEIDEENHEASVSGRPLCLTLTEFRLLAELVRNAGRVRTRETLMSRVWGYDSEAMSRTVDTHVRRLRKKLGAASAWLGTVRGVGYRVRPPESDAS